MRVLAPLRSSREVGSLCAAGADEFYCGLTPAFWADRYGDAWVHRRNPRSAGIPDLKDLRSIVSFAEPRPVYVTLNAPSYPADAIAPLVEFGRRVLEDVGVAGLIVAEMELLLALSEAGLARRVHVSSLATCTNSGTAAFYRDLGVARIILPRHLTLGEIEAILIPGVDFEVFVINDGCVFEEGLCATTHALGTFCLEDGPGTSGLASQALERYEFWKWTLNNCGCRTSGGYPLGPCGLCAVPRLLELGIRSLKVVGREASAARKAASVELTARAVRIAEAGGVPEQVREMVTSLRGAKNLCDGAHICYYPDVWHDPREETAAC